jgi:hypothetical protein
MIIKLTPAITLPVALNLTIPSTFEVEDGFKITEVFFPAKVSPLLITVAVMIGGYLNSAAPNE